MRTLGLAIIVVALVSGAVFALIFYSAPPSTRELDADLAAVDVQISTSIEDSSRYQGGVLKAVIDMRTEVLRTTRAFLDMKRTALLRRVDLDYRIDGSAVLPDPDGDAALDRDIASASGDLAESKAEADRYSGGLVQAMALARVATNELTLAQLNLAKLARRYGFLVQLRPMESAPVVPVGQSTVTNDGDAL